MKKPIGSYSLYISLGLLALAIGGSVFFYKKEFDKAKRLRAEVVSTRDHIRAVIMSAKPTEEHRKHLEQESVKVEKNYQEIVRQALQWNYVPRPMSGLEFHGYMGNTIDMIQAAARAQSILIHKKAKYLGFQDYEVQPPGLDEDVLQLQREFSAAVDIAQLLVASGVYSIDKMVRRDEARMDEGTPTSLRDRLIAQQEATGRRKSKYDFYDTVPFRVHFTCTYPSLAFFMKSLISPRKYGENRLPVNFLVINDMRYKVKEDETREEREKLRRAGGGTTLPSVPAYAPAGRRTRLRLEDYPPDLPEAESLVLQFGEMQAYAFFRRWNTWSEVEKEIYRLTKKLEGQISGDQREELAARLERKKKEFIEGRNLKGRAPEYSTLEVVMFIDFVQFTDALVAELEEEKEQPKRSVASLSTAKSE
jgi:hypothetical protein